jgi:predicted regulator of Ras-like GTPase activity (Roadblock/LC7/MglB family)
MSDLEQMARLPGVTGAVRSDLQGTLLEQAREPNAEAVAAVMGFVASALSEAGETLGLGSLARLSLVGRGRSCVLVARPGALLSAFVEPPQLAGAVEKSLDSLFQEWS